MEYTLSATTSAGVMASALGGALELFPSQRFKI